MRICRLVLSVCLVFSVTSSYAVNNLLLNYVQLVRALENGNDVKAIIHLDNCLISDTAVQNQIMQNIDGASTRFNLTRYLHYNVRINGQLKDTVVTSMTDFVQQPTGEFWTIFSRLSFYDDNTVTLHVNYYDTPHHKSHLVVDWLCDISNGRDELGVVLYDNP